MKTAMTTTQYAQAVLDGANHCEKHHSGIQWPDVAEVIGAFEGCSCAWDGGGECGSWCDREGAAVLLLKDGRYAAVWEDEDTTGHG